MDAIERFLLQVEWRFSRFRPDSEVSRFNTTREHRPSRLLSDLLQVAEPLRRGSGGLFNPLVGAQVIAAGYDRTFDAIGSGSVQRGPAGGEGAPVSGGLIALGDGRYRLPEGTRLDVGGIAKGWAADRGAEFLGQLGPACVDAGGDVRVAGAWPADGGFEIEIENPFLPDTDLGTLRLTEGSLATSGIAKRWWMSGGELRHHLIDPRTGKPVDTELLCVTAHAPTAAEAEVAAKTAFILGAEEGAAWLNAHGYAGLFVARDGAVTGDLLQG